MNVRRQVQIVLAVCGLAAGLGAVEARAESVLVGKFELPAAAYWGDTLLQPGEYTIQMTRQSRDLPIFRLSGEGLQATFLAAAKPERESGRNYLEVVDIGGTYVIRAFDSGILGESFAFGVTKRVKSKALQASMQPALEVPVAGE